jgi:hypothetical protein
VDDYDLTASFFAAEGAILVAILLGGAFFAVGLVALVPKMLVDVLISALRGKNPR